MVKKVSILMVLLLMMTLIPAQSFANEYNLYINGNKTEGMIMEHSGVKLLPLRYLANGLNLELMWNQKDLAASTVFDGKDVIFKAGNDMAMVGGMSVRLDHPPTLMHGRLYISEMTLYDIMGLKVTYDGMKAEINLPKDIIDVAVEAGSFKTLAAALEAADLIGALKGDGPFTVFAPTDEAFAKLPAGTVESLLLPENKAKLIDILTYHVVAGEVKSSDVVNLEKATMLNGKDVKITIDGSNVMVNQAKVIAVDIEASNGVIHVIDEVIIPES